MGLNIIADTTNKIMAGSLRISLAVMFLMTGAMKLLVPMLGEAFSGQLLVADIPFYTLSRWLIPFLEIAIGAVLAIGAYSRLATLLILPIMAVATYVHLVVDDPSLFPLQPSEPIIPLVVIGISRMRSLILIVDPGQETTKYILLESIVAETNCVEFLN